MLDQRIAQAFNLQENAVLIASDEHPVYRAGDVIVRQQAVAAYWLGPYRGNSAVLDAFAGVRAFDQMLLRAGLRMLLIRNEFGQTDDLSAFAMASDIICAWVDRGSR